jgi:hypothetical protein
MHPKLLVRELLENLELIKCTSPNAAMGKQENRKNQNESRKRMPQQ